MDRQARHHYRFQISVALLLLQVVATALHVVPDLVYARSAIRTTTRIVAEINSLGPVWVLLFGATALFLGGALWWGRREFYAHLACAGVWVFYAAGLWLGAFVAQPHGTVFFPIIVSCVAGLHTILAASFNEDLANAKTKGVQA